MDKLMKYPIIVGLIPMIVCLTLRNVTHYQLGRMESSPQYEDTIYVEICDSVIKNQDVYELIMHDVRNQEGINPFWIRDSLRYPLHAIRKINITDKGGIEDCWIDSVFFNNMSIESVFILKIYEDTIFTHSWVDKQGGYGFTNLYVKGYKVSSSQGKGYYISHRTPYEPNIQLPIAPLCYSYEFDKLGRVCTISDDLNVLYSIEYDSIGSWRTLNYKNIHVKRITK